MTKLANFLFVLLLLCKQHQAAEQSREPLPQTWTAWAKLLAEQFVLEAPEIEIITIGDEWRPWATDYLERFVLAAARPYLRQWQAAWNKAERIELHSLSSFRDGKQPTLRKYYSVVGTATITDPAEIATLATLLPALIAEGDNPDQQRAGCFQPHHGLSIVIGKQQHDLIICFTCHNTAVHSESLPKGEQQVEYPTEEQRKLVEQILEKHKIPTSYKYEAEQLQLRQKAQEARENEESKKNHPPRARTLTAEWCLLANHAVYAGFRAGCRTFAPVSTLVPPALPD